MKQYYVYFFLCFLVGNLLRASVAPIVPGEGLCKIVSRIGSHIDVIDSKVSVINAIDTAVLSKTNIIQSNVDIIEPQTVSVINQYDAIDSQVDGLELLLERINQQGLSPYVDNRKSFDSIFGDQIVEHRFDILNFMFIYGIQPIDFTTTLSGGGTATTSSSMAVLSSGTATTALARIQSKRLLRYRTGREGYCFFTAMFATSTASSTQWIGLFDDDNGSAVGYSGTNFALLFRRNGVNTIISQANFNRDPLDGTGSSRFVIDPTKLNVFRIAYGWLGAATISYQILDSSGIWVTFHEIDWNNTNTGPSYINPMLPMRAEVQKNAAGALNLQLSTASWSAGIAYYPPDPSNRFFSIGNTTPVTLPSGTTETHLLTIRNKSTYTGLTNRMEVVLVYFAGGSTNDTITTSSILYLKKNATVTGTSFVDINTADSIVEYSTAGTYSAGTGMNMIIYPSSTAGQFKGPLCLPPAEYEIILLPGDSVTVTASNVSGATRPSNAAGCSLAWRERF